MCELLKRINSGKSYKHMYYCRHVNIYTYIEAQLFKNDSDLWKTVPK